MAEFKVGGLVVCVKSVQLISDSGETFTYTKNIIYIVRDLKVCGCGTVALHLGDIRKDVNPTSTCKECNYKLVTQKVWVAASNFLPLDDFKEVTFTKINEEVPVSAQ